MITEKIKIEDESELLLLKSEFEGLKKPRFDIKFNGNLVMLNAKDETALKSIKNSFLQARTVYKKISGIQ